MHISTNLWYHEGNDLYFASTIDLPVHRLYLFLGNGDPRIVFGVAAVLSGPVERFSTCFFRASCKPSGEIRGFEYTALALKFVYGLCLSLSLNASTMRDNHRKISASPRDAIIYP
jgi:hypothetical protein